MCFTFMCIFGHTVMEKIKMDGNKWWLKRHLIYFNLSTLLNEYNCILDLEAIVSFFLKSCLTWSVSLAVNNYYFLSLPEPDSWSTLCIWCYSSHHGSDGCCLYSWKSSFFIQKTQLLSIHRNEKRSRCVIFTFSVAPVLRTKSECFLFKILWFIDVISFSLFVVFCRFYN